MKSGWPGVLRCAEHFACEIKRTTDHHPSGAEPERAVQRRLDGGRGLGSEAMTPSKLGVKGIPTLMLFRDGQLSSLKVGAMPKGKIVEWLAESGIKADA